MADTDFHTLPVVGSDGELLGIITHDDVIDIMREEGTEDLQKLAGAGATKGIFRPDIRKHKTALALAACKFIYGSLSPPA